MKKFLCFLLMSSFLGSSYYLFSVGSVSFYAFRIVFVVFTVCFLLFKRDIKRKKLPRHAFSRYVFLMGAFILFMTASVVLTPSFSLWINGCIHWSINIALIYYVYVYSDTEEDLNIYMKAYMLGLLITMIVAIFEYLTGIHIGDSSYLQNYSIYSWEFEALSKFPTAFLYNPNNVGVAMMIAVSFSGLFIKDRKGSMILCIAWAACCVYVAFATGSRAAILFVVLLFAVIVFSMPATRTTKFFRIVAVVVGVFTFVQLFSKFLGLQLERSGLFESTIGIGKTDAGRMTLLETAFQTSKESWFFGIGPGAAEAAMSRFAGREFTSVHNFAMELLVTTGFGGSLFFWVFYFRCLKKQWELRDKLPISGTLVTVVLSFLFVGLVPPTIITLHFVWIIFGFALAAEKIYYIKTL